MPRRLKTVLGAAALISVVTLLARVAGFGRQLVFSGTVGETLLGTVYTTVNAVPNIAFEVVAGGALASVVVPVLAGPVAAGAKKDADRIASALLTWVVLALTPLVLLGLLAARPVADLMLAGKADEPGASGVGARMLFVFVPQILLYGIAVVTGGILQAHHRFVASTVAPLISSVTVAASYVVFAAAFDVDLNDMANLPRDAELVLSLGTTAGVLALALCTIVPLRRTGLRFRPTLHFPDGVARKVRTLAGAGVATLIAQQGAMLTVLLLNNRTEVPHGAVVVYQNAWMVYLLPYAILAVPIATAAFPKLSTLAHEEDHPGFARTTAVTTRQVLLASGAGTLLLIAAAWPVGWFFGRFMEGDVDPDKMVWALIAFAPGLIGYGLIAQLGRVLNASGHGRTAATCTVLGWLTVVAADLALTAAMPPEWTVVALGLGNTVGMTVAGTALTVATGRRVGHDAVRGIFTNT